VAATTHPVAAASTAMKPSTSTTMEPSADRAMEPSATHPAADATSGNHWAASDSATDSEWTTDVSAEPTACNRCWVPTYEPTSSGELSGISVEVTIKLVSVAIKLVTSKLMTVELVTMAVEMIMAIEAVVEAMVERTITEIE
jgi:hypothetical protein